MLCYSKALDMLGNRYKRKLQNNTYLYKEDNDIIVRFWSTDIITFKKNGNMILYNGGYETATTRARLNQYLDYSFARIETINNQWFLKDKTNQLFNWGYNRVEFNSDGYITNIKPYLKIFLSEIKEKRKPVLPDLKTTDIEMLVREKNHLQSKHIYTRKIFPVRFNEKVDAYIKKVSAIKRKINVRIKELLGTLTDLSVICNLSENNNIPLEFIEKYSRIKELIAGITDLNTLDKLFNRYRNLRTIIINNCIGGYLPLIVMNVDNPWKTIAENRMKGITS